MNGRGLSGLLALLALLAGTAAAAEPTLSLPLGEGAEIEMVLVPKGTFEQGSPADAKGRGTDEAPRQVTISCDFYIAKYPITRGQFARFVRETNYRTEAERGTSGGFGWDGTRLVQRKEFTWRNPGFEQTDDHPVVIVTHGDARAFAAWLTKKAGRKIELPTEAQWEYACRAGTGTRFYNGDDEDKLGDIAWFKANAGDGTRAVGKKEANAWGLHDMAGNVYEWCRDWYGPYEPGPVTDPEEVRRDRSDKPRRVLRGGSWLRDAAHCRSAARYRNDPGSRNADNGFRVVADVEKSAGTGSDFTAPTEEVPTGTSEPAIPERAEAPRDLGAWPCVCCLAVPGALGAVVFLVFRSWGRGRFVDRAGVPPPPGVRVRPASDGFWVTVPGVRRGSVLRYRCRAGGVMRTGNAVYEPGPEGYFVYTGGTPAGVEITDVFPPGSGAPDISTGPSYYDDTGPATPPPRPARRHPPAY